MSQPALLRRRFDDDLLALCPELATASPGTLRSERFPFLRRVVMIGSEPRGAVEPWSVFLDAGETVSEGVLDAAAAEVHPSDPALIVYSSGTTAEPTGLKRCTAVQKASTFVRSPSCTAWMISVRRIGEPAGAGAGLQG